MKKYLGSVIAAIALALSSCTPTPEPVMIAADPSDPEQLVLAEIYRQIAEFDGRQVGIVGLSMPSASDKFELLQSGRANLGVFCVGDLVRAENPGEFSKLMEMKGGIDAGDVNNGELELASYDAAVATLPARLSTVDPSPAQGCGVAGAENGQGPELPQNIIPVFSSGLFDRGMRQAMNKATRALNTEDLAELVEQTEKDGDPRAAVNDWLRSKTNMSVELDRIVDEGEARDI